MAEKQKAGLFRYLKEAFMFRWNLLLFLGGGFLVVVGGAVVAVIIAKKKKAAPAMPAAFPGQGTATPGHRSSRWGAAHLL